MDSGNDLDFLENERLECEDCGKYKKTYGLLIVLLQKKYVVN